MLLRHLTSIVALPVIVILILPIMLVSLFPYVSFWSIQYPDVILLLVAGVVVTGSGLILAYSTVSLFIKMGNGTIAPWNPQEN